MVIHESVANPTRRDLAPLTSVVDTLDRSGLAGSAPRREAANRTCFASKMKLIVALAAGAAAFTGPAARLPTAGVARVTKTQQPAMLLGGLRARANKALVPTRRP